MLERLEGLPAGIVGIKASGIVHKDEYERELEPLFAAAKKEGRRFKLLYQLAPGFEAITPAAAMSDGKMGLRHVKQLEACAVVSDMSWLTGALELTRFLIPCPVRSFSNASFGEAVSWLSSVAGTPRASHRLLAEQGVIVLDVREALDSNDFEALADAMDAWIAEHGQLNGLVVHAQRFPGWENISALFGHLRFVRDHHDKIRRVALATDEPAAGIASVVAELFVHARVYAFPFESLEAAVEWAGAPSAP
ncbi:MAG TPA: STAS/SEC14 domain-containing protein [Polyangiaceae bacterium]|nr:STAS/SEC14 domain-containing protein [Polyangiaceae bacterium]